MWEFKNGSKVIGISSTKITRGNNPLKPSMWCPECNIWTKEYSHSGDHDCGSEVRTSGLDSGFPDIDYEGEGIK